MAYPPAYVRAYSFTDFETLNPGEPKPGDKLDTEYDAVSNALTATQTALALIQRADGALANESVGEDQLQAGLFDAIGDAAVADAEAAAAAAAASASAAAGSASSASSSASAASASAATASGAAAQAGVSQGIAQSAANDAALSAADSFDSAQISANAGNEAQGFRNEAEGFTDLAFKWAELLTGPVLPAPPGWPEAVDDGMFSSKWWAIRAREYNSTTTIDLGTAGADIGEAFDIWAAIPGNELGVGQTYATWGSPVQTYVLIDRSNPSDPASWQNITGGPGPPGPANTLTVGTVTTGAPGSSAVVSITGTSPNQVLDMSIPRGDVGATGPIGPAGPPNALAIGTVTTVPDGTPSSATITGTAPTQTLNLVLTAGPQGIQGIQGIQGPAGPAVNLANPTGTIGLTAVNGVATTAPRSDSSPALSQAIVPTWTGSHTFSNTTTLLSAASPQLRFNATGQAADEKMWVQQVSGKQFLIRSVTDLGGTPRNAIAITKGTGNSATFLEFGNATDNTNYFFLGNGPVQVNGTITVPAGSALQPSYGFTADTDSGIYQSAVSHVNIGINNASVVDVTTALVTIAGGLVMGVPTGGNKGTGTVNATALYVNNVAVTTGAHPTGANPTASVGLTAVNGAAATFMRSDGAPALDQAIAPTWTGLHTFSSATVEQRFIENDQAVDEKTWRFRVAGRLLTWSAIDDALTSGHNFIAVTRGTGSGATVLSMAFGNAGDNPTYSFLGTGVVTSGGAYRGPDGAVGAPAYSFTSDTNTGLYRRAADVIGVAAGGNDIVAFAHNAALPVSVGSQTYLAGPTGTLNNAGQLLFGDTTGWNFAFATRASSVTTNIMVIDDRGYVQFRDGSAGSPSISFISDPDTGLWRAGADQVRMSAGGLSITIWGTTFFAARVPIQAADGTLALPGFTFENDPDTGFYRGGTNTIVAAVGGAQSMIFSPSLVYVNQTTVFQTGDGSAATPGLGFSADPDTGILRAAANRMAFSTGGQVGGWFTPPGAGAGGGFCVTGQIDAGYFSTTYMDYVPTSSTGRIGVVNGAGAAGALLLACTGVEAPAFTSTSSRAIKRVTGAPRRASDILSKLRPLLYRLLEGDDREQLGLIAEDVHEACPQLSDGKSVAYDRLAILLLAAWQEEHAEAA